MADEKQESPFAFKLSKPTAIGHAITVGPSHGAKTAWLQDMIARMEGRSTPSEK